MNQRAQEPRPAPESEASGESDPTREESTPEQPVVQHSGTPLVEPAEEPPPADSPSAG